LNLLILGATETIQVVTIGVLEVYHLELLCLVVKWLWARKRIVA